MKAIAYRNENGENFDGNIPFIQIPSGGDAGVESTIKELTKQGMKDITLFDCPPFPEEVISITWDTVKEKAL